MSIAHPGSRRIVGRVLAAPAILGLLVVLGVQVARAQGGYEIEVYGSETALRKSITFELHANTTLQGAEGTAACILGPVVDDSRRRLSFSGAAAAADCGSSTLPFAQWVTGPGLLLSQVAQHPVTGGSADTAAGLPSHGTLEVTTGLTPWAELGVYLFTTEGGGIGTQWSGASVRPMVRVPRSWHWPLGIAVSTEVEYERPTGSAAAWTWEIRPIVDRALGRWYFSVNPTLEYPLGGASSGRRVQFSPSAKSSFDLVPAISAGVEYYGAYGPVGNFAAPDNRLQQLFGVVDLHLSPRWEINAGVGAGMTPATSKLVAKLIVGRRFSWGGDPAVKDAPLR